jgi:hypothetical protein
MTMTRRDFQRLADVLVSLPHPIDHAELVRRLALEVCAPANPHFRPEQFAAAAGSPDAVPSSRCEWCATPTADHADRPEDLCPVHRAEYHGETLATLERAEA